MSIQFVQGDLFKHSLHALVNPVNTVGVMGKGLALAFKKKFPSNFQCYEVACRYGQVQTGRMFVTQDPAGQPEWIINFPTKQHWRNPTHIDWVTTGLDHLRDVLVNNQIRSVGIPAIGAGLGGLPWPMVKKEIVARLGDLEGIDIYVFEPQEQKEPARRRLNVGSMY